MRSAIIGGTGFYKMAEGDFVEEAVATPYGEVLVHLGQGENSDLVFLPRHGTDHTVPPHRLNFRANLKALAAMDVKAAVAIFTVGSLQRSIPPRSLVVLDQFMDFTSGREATYFDGGDSGLAHAEVNEPYCATLRNRLLAFGNARGVPMLETGTYVCTNGPRFETPAEVRMYAQMGGHVVGMTGIPEVTLARELGIHYAGVALSVNWGAGLEKAIQIEREGMEELRRTVVGLCIDSLRAFPPLAEGCECARALMVLHPPRDEQRRP
jgi:5'-methylthioadenosine phosphorylase